MSEASDRSQKPTSPSPPARDESSPVVRGAGAFVLAAGFVVVALIAAVALYASGQPNMNVMQRCLMDGGSGVGNCGGNTMGGPALLIVVAGFGIAGWIWRRR